MLCNLKWNSNGNHISDLFKNLFSHNINLDV